MSENVIFLTEIKRLRDDDHKLFRLTALLEYKLKSIHPDLKISETSTGEISEDLNWSPPDLFQLIIYYKDRFNNFSEIDTARKIRNKLGAALMKQVKTAANRGVRHYQHWPYAPFWQDNPVAEGYLG